MKSSAITEHKNNYEVISNIKTQEQIWSHQQYQNTRTNMASTQDFGQNKECYKFHKNIA